MTSYLVFGRSAFSVGALLGALSFSSSAQAVTDTAFRYTAEKTGTFSIHHMAMIPADKDSANNYTVTWGSGLKAMAGSCFNTAVNLPNGAKISTVQVFFSSGADANVETYLFRHQLNDGTGDSIAQKIFFDDSGVRKAGLVSIKATTEVVNNLQYAYGFGICLGNADTFYGARIQYKYMNAGD
jgi:hypothetical protein